ncbi:hypothetical protein EAH_00004350 [Eimeria acervulina]|uniref:Uncharacterized protein n=1 Tax=Eimeria acervulina TaxID=5801 RepID=U6GC90_EIMAC|nr:hypothetical protein EAH_00004350 [Eimeria acervulina]CDI77142.1 hypothetical protein EAH_00004350 [Eimeria acervulina]
MIFPKGAVASVPALPNTASTARKRSPSPGRSAHCPHTKQHSTNELQQHLSGKILQQLRTEVQQRLQQKVKEQLHTYRQQIPTPTNQKTLCDRRANGQIVHLPQPEAPQDKGSAAQAEMDMLQQHDRTRWSSETSATGTATPVFLSGSRGKKRGPSRLKRSYSGPVNATFQLWDQPALPNPVPEACEQRMQWLQSWSSEAQGLKEKQLLATLKELNTRPDFALVDVWRVFDPEGAGISEARRVQDGFSRLGIRCSGQEAQCFIWYYCPPHPIGRFRVGWPDL